MAAHIRAGQPASCSTSAPDDKSNPRGNHGQAPLRGRQPAEALDSSVRHKSSTLRPADLLPPPVGFQVSATGLDLGFYAARSYSLMRPPRTGRRLISSCERPAGGWEI